MAVWIIGSADPAGPGSLAGGPRLPRWAGLDIVKNTPDGVGRGGVMQAPGRSVHDPANRALDLERGGASGSIAWAEAVLRDQEMPPDELRVLLTTADRELVHRHVELHLERLEEWLITQRRSVAAAEGIFTEAAGRRRSLTGHPHNDEDAALRPE
jgi:hypothetical protein